MKTLLLAVIALIMTIGAVSAQKCMYVWMKDGTHLSIPVSSFDSVGFYAPTYTLSVTIVDKTAFAQEITDDTGWKFTFELSYNATAFHSNTGWGHWLNENEQTPTGNPYGFKD